MADRRLRTAPFSLWITSIEAVGTEVDIPPDAQVIDVKGKSLLPGMMDLHVHLRGPYHSLQKLRKSLLAGFTTIAHVCRYYAARIDRLSSGY